MAKSLLNITASFYMAHILLMAASYEHPAQYSEGASLDGKLKKIWKNTKWHLLVFDANKYLKQVAKAAKRQKVSPIELEEIQRHISNIKQFSGKSTINAIPQNSLFGFLKIRWDIPISGLNRHVEAYPAHIWQ